MRKREKMSKADKVLIAIIEVCAAVLFVAAFVTVGAAMMGCSEADDNVVWAHPDADVADANTDGKVTNYVLTEDGEIKEIEEVEENVDIDDVLDTTDTEASAEDDDVSAVYHTPGEPGCMSNWQTYQLAYCIV